MPRIPASVLRIVFPASPLLLLVLLSPVVQSADVNGYTAEYECRAGNPNCDIDVAALGQRMCEQTIAPSAPWSSINWENDTICIEAGDHTAKGGLTIPASANGTPSNYKVLRYTRGEDNDDEPWHQPSANQAKLSRLVIQGDYWLIHRLTFPAISGVPDRIQYFATASNDVRDIIIDRVLIEGSGPGSNFYGISTNGTQSWDYQGLSVQNSVMRNVGPVGPPSESIGISLHVGEPERNSRYYIVNNEIYDWVSHPIQLGRNQHPTIPGIVVENNDLYVTSALYTDCAGNYTPTGPCAASESVISNKAFGVAGNETKIIQNRVWGTRSTDMNLCCNGTDGAAIGNYDNNDYLLFQNNVIMDAPIGINNAADNDSFVGNLFYWIRAFRPDKPSATIHRWFSHDGAAAYEAYSNSVILVERNSFPPLADANVDARCNVFIDSGAKASGTPQSSSIADYNAFYGTPTFSFNGTNTTIDKQLKLRANNTNYLVGDVIRRSDSPKNECTVADDADCFLYAVTQAGTTASTAPAYCTTLGCSISDGGVVVKAIRGPYVFKRKLRTVAGGETVVIPYARVHADADEANFCPGEGQANAVGLRTGIGVNDNVGWNGILSADLIGTARAGTAGSLEVQASGGSEPPPGESEPFYGTPLSIPGTVEAEDFDNGGEGVAYHDVDAGNNGNSAYRSTDVDLSVDQGSSNGHLVSWARTGEWLQYTVNVASAGEYTLEVAVAANGQGGSFHIEFDGVDKTGAISVPDTGGWFAWQTLTRSVTLSAGQQIVRLVMDSVGPTNGSVGNFDYARLSFVAGSTPFYGTPLSIPGTVEAEDFDNGGEGVAYHDVDAGNNGNSTYRSTDVDLSVDQGSSNGHLVSWARTGEWLQYTVNVASAGEYTLEVAVAANGQGGSFHIEFDGVDKTGAISVPDTGGWFAWQTLTRSVTLSAGQQIVRLVMDSVGPTNGSVGNFDYIRFTLLDPALIGHWSLDDGGGTVAADTQGNNAALQGATWTTGQSGSALAFDGVSDYAEIAHRASYLADEGTVAFWFNSASLSGTRGLFSKDANGFGSGGHLSILTSENALQARLQSTSATFALLAAGPLQANTWHHAALTFGPAGLRLYLDGQLAASNAYTGGLGSSSGGTGNAEPIALGASTGFSDPGSVTPLSSFFAGALDEVRIYSRALSAAEVADLAGP